jgi:saccharopine dehydrogenase-like NADP-dependent oxidoreductase
MVRITIAGGAGSAFLSTPTSFDISTKVSKDVGQEIIDALVATGKYEITILTRRVSTSILHHTSEPGLTSQHQDPPADLPTKNIKYLKSDYSSVNDLVELLRGTHTVLSFISPFDQDAAFTTQKKIIDACILAGVKRFAPSEWGS